MQHKWQHAMLLTCAKVEIPFPFWIKCTKLKLLCFPILCLQPFTRLKSSLYPRRAWDLVATPRRYENSGGARLLARGLWPQHEPWFNSLSESLSVTLLLPLLTLEEPASVRNVRVPPAREICKV